MVPRVAYTRNLRRILRRAAVESLPLGKAGESGKIIERLASNDVNRTDGSQCADA